MTRKPRLVRLIWDAPFIEGVGRYLQIRLGERLDLHGPEDLGRWPMAGFEITFRVARTWTSIEDGAPWWRGWACRVWWRSAAREILQRQSADA